MLTKQPWKQEIIWVQRNSDDVIVGIREKLPDGVDFIPNLNSSGVAIRNNKFGGKGESNGD